MNRAEAIASGAEFYFTGRPCARGHIEPRRVDNRTCVACAVLTCRTWEIGHRDQRRSICKSWREKNAEYNKQRCRQWRDAYPEKQRQSDRNWRLNNPGSAALKARRRKARRSGAAGSHTTADIETIRRLQKNRCAYCRCRLHRDNTNVDHIIPLARGGSDDRTNLQLLCRPCNLDKHAKDPIVYAQTMGRLL